MSGSDLATLWTSIEAAGVPQSALRFLETGVNLGNAAVLAGLDGSGQRHLCLPASAAEIGRKDGASRGVTIEARRLLDARGSEAPFVDVHCHRPDLNSLFEIVCSEILVACGLTKDSPFTVAHQVLERWRALLEPSRSALLGPQQLAAILAELLLLERLGTTRTPPLQYWTGPDKGPHDFVCGPVDFEVKSTLRTTERAAEINGLAQLAVAPGTLLYLWFVRLRPAPGRGVTVPATTDRLVAAGLSSPALMTKLAKVGYLPADAAAYSQLSFDIVETLLYRVDETFPRITRTSFNGTLPAQITNIDYAINLDAPLPVPLTAAEASAIFDGVR